MSSKFEHWLSDHRCVYGTCSWWPTPTAWLARRPGNLTCTTKPRHGGKVSRELTDALGRRGHVGEVNPDWVEWLMGLPTKWTELEEVG